MTAVLCGRIGTGGSAYFHESWRAGDMAEVGPLSNHLPLSSMVKRHTLIAGGIGITPILATA